MSRRQRGISVRPATLDDVDAMIRIWHTIWDGDYRRYFPATPELRRSVDALRVLLEPIIEQFAVVTLDGKLAGFGSQLGDLVDDMWVDPALQDCRLGPRLLAHLTDRIRKNGHRRAELHCIARNDGARRFYEREGWRFVRFESDPKGEFEVPFVVYERDL